MFDCHKISPIQVSFESPFLLYSCFWTICICATHERFELHAKGKMRSFGLVFAAYPPIPFLLNFHNIKISHPTIKPRAMKNTLPTQALVPSRDHGVGCLQLLERTAHGRCWEPVPGAPGSLAIVTTRAGSPWECHQKSGHFLYLFTKNQEDWGCDH